MNMSGKWNERSASQMRWNGSIIEKITAEAISRRLFASITAPDIIPEVNVKFSIVINGRLSNIGFANAIKMMKGKKSISLLRIVPNERSKYIAMNNGKAAYAVTHARLNFPVDITEITYIAHIKMNDLPFIERKNSEDAVSLCISDIFSEFFKIDALYIKNRPIIFSSSKSFRNWPQSVKPGQIL